MVCEVKLRRQVRDEVQLRHERRKTVLFASLALFLSACLPATAAEPAGESTDPLPRALAGREVIHGAIPSMALAGEEVGFTLYAPAGMARGAVLPMVVYLRNLPEERIGTVPDEELIRGFLDQKMLVAVVDYGKRDLGRSGRRRYEEVSWLYTTFGAAKHSPVFQQSGGQGRDPVAVACDESRLTFKTHSGAEFSVDPDWVYVIPEGYTLVRDVEVMKLPYPAPRHRVRMDLMVPAKPKRPVPLVLELSARSTGAEDKAMTPFCFNTIYPMTYAQFGYGVAVMGFVFEEPAPGESTAFGRDFAEHKALRLLRARKTEWGLSGKIGLMGMSKSATRVLLAAAKRTGQRSVVTPEMAQRYPYSVFYRGAIADWMARDYPEDMGRSIFPFKSSDAYLGIPEERDLGPYATENDCPDVIHCGAVGVPADLPHVIPYLTDRLPPVIFCTGNEDGYVGWRPGQICAKLLRDVFQAAGVKKVLYVEQDGLGHAFNHLRFDEFKAFFDSNLKEKVNP